MLLRQRFILASALTLLADRYTEEAESQIARYEALGYGSFPVCVAKTHLSLSSDAS